MNSGFMGGQMHPAAVHALASRKRKLFDQVTDVMILKIFSPKNCKKLAFLTRNKAKLCKNFDHNIGF
jgi:hypothetical protein